MDSSRHIGEEPRSHRVIEKRRRDRINTCLTELSRAVPAACAKQMSGKLEKAEILEMTVKHLQMLEMAAVSQTKGDWGSDLTTDYNHNYQTGYHDCVLEVARFASSMDTHHLPSQLRCQRLLSHLRAVSPPRHPPHGGATFRERPQTLDLAPRVPVTLHCSPLGDVQSTMTVRHEVRKYTMENPISALPVHRHHLAAHNRFLPYDRASGLSRYYHAHIL